MLQRMEMDEHVPLGDQLAEEVGPVTLINTFKVAPEDADALLAAWAADAAYLKTKPRLHLHPALPRHRRQRRVRKPGGLGVGGGLPQRHWGSAVPGDLRPLSRLHGGLTASFPEAGRARHLRGPLAPRPQQLSTWPRSPRCRPPRRRVHEGQATADQRRGADWLLTATS